MQTNQEIKKKNKIKSVIAGIFNLKPKTNDLTLEEWERLEMRKPTRPAARSPRGLI